MHRPTDPLTLRDALTDHQSVNSNNEGLPFKPYRKIIQSVMGLVYSIPISETTDGVARELGARTRLCLKRKVSNTLTPWRYETHLH